MKFFKINKTEVVWYVELDGTYYLRTAQFTSPDGYEFDVHWSKLENGRYERMEDGSETYQSLQAMWHEDSKS